MVMPPPIVREFPVRIRNTPLALDQTDTLAFLTLAWGGGYYGPASRVLRRRGGYVHVLGAPRRHVKAPYRAFAEQVCTWTLTRVSPAGHLDTVIALGDLRVGMLDIRADGTSTLSALGVRAVPSTLAGLIELRTLPTARPVEAPDVTVDHPVVEPVEWVRQVAVAARLADPDLAGHLSEGRWRLWSLERRWEKNDYPQLDMTTVLETPGGYLRSGYVDDEHPDAGIALRPRSAEELWCQLTAVPSLLRQQEASGFKRQTDSRISASPSALMGHIATRRGIVCADDTESAEAP